MKKSLVIPTYNEAEVIGETLFSLRSAFNQQPDKDGWEIIVVDNASTDSTADVVTAIGDSRIHLVRLEEKGKGRAVRRGFAVCSGDIVGFTDADLSVSPDQVVSAFLMVQNDPTVLIVGSRFHPESNMPDREWWRLASSVLFNLLARIIVGVVSTDTQCPLKVMTKDAGLTMLRTRENTWFFDLEFLALSTHFRKIIKEIPVLWTEHRYLNRKSKLTLLDSARAIFAMFRIRRRIHDID